MRVYTEPEAPQGKKPLFLKLVQENPETVIVRLVDARGEFVKNLLGISNDKCHSYGKAKPGADYECDLPFDEDGKLIVN